MAETLTRVLSLALRHKPELFNVSIDNSGWTPLATLAAAITAHFPALPVSDDGLRSFVATQTVERFEIQDGRIRALYGHSLSHVSVGEPNEPPPLLFHATQAMLLPRIKRDGLLAKGRNGVHLTSRWSYALSIRDTHDKRGKRGVILAVRTADTAFKGIPFYQATDHIWLCPYIPARFLNQVPMDHRSSPPTASGTLIPLDNLDKGGILRAELELLDTED